VAIITLALGGSFILLLALPAARFIPRARQWSASRPGVFWYLAVPAGEQILVLGITHHAELRYLFFPIGLLALAASVTICPMVASRFTGKALVVASVPGSGVAGIKVSAIRLLTVALLAATTLTLIGGPRATARAPKQDGCPSGLCIRRVVLVISPDGPGATVRIGKDGGTHDTLLGDLERRKLAIALLSTSQGEYDRHKALIDISQGARQPPALYPPPLERLVLALNSDGGGEVSGWSDALRRARSVSTTLHPGLLAQSIPNGAAFVGASGDRTDAAFVAADATGQVAEVSTGTRESLAQRAQAALNRRSLVVVGLPLGAAGRAALSQLLSNQQAGEMLIFAQIPPTPPEKNIEGFAPRRYFRQTDTGIAWDLGAGTLTSASTRQPGLVTAIDFAPTILDHLRIPVPKRMRGQVVAKGPTRSAEQLDFQRHRWEQLRSGRQPGSIRMIVLLAGLIFLILGAFRGLSRNLGDFTLRVVGLGLMWWPVSALAAAVFHPKGALVESLIIGGLSVALGVLTDRLAPWPRGPALPALAALVFLTADLSFGGHLLITSVAGPSLASGNRFYGVSNELEPILPVLILAGIAALAGVRKNILPKAFAAAGVVLALVLGWGRLGADAGGVITAAAAFAAACIASLSGRLTRKRVLGLALAPVVALVLLIAVDLLFAGKSHLSLNLTRATGIREIWELVARRYELAVGLLGNAGGDAAFVIAALVVYFVFRNRDLLLPAMPEGYRAALIGGLVGGLAGAFSNDSGPVLFVNAVGALLAVVVYLRGHPGQVSTKARG